MRNSAFRLVANFAHLADDIPKVESGVFYIWMSWTAIYVPQHYRFESSAAGQMYSLNDENVFDVHLMIDNPDSTSNLLPRPARNNHDVPYRSARTRWGWYGRLRSVFRSASVSILKTPAELSEPVIDLVDMVPVMTVKAGLLGPVRTQEKKCCHKITQIARPGPRFLSRVDGGLAKIRLARVVKAWPIICRGPLFR